MSTKCSISYGDNFHLYKEVLENDAVYLNVQDVEFTAFSDTNNTDITLRFDLELAKTLGLINET